VGIEEGRQEISGVFNTPFKVADTLVQGKFRIRLKEGKLHWEAPSPLFPTAAFTEIIAQNEQNGSFSLEDVRIGRDFHWERLERQTFAGSLVLLATAEGIVVINEIGIEDYLSVVIASEMSAEAPLEFLKAQAITARSWALAALEYEEEAEHREWVDTNTLLCWYGRGKHKLYDFCADDHCQRYHGLGRHLARRCLDATKATSGVFLISAEGKICDARYHKACGGFTERFDIAWQAGGAPYLIPVVDSGQKHPFIADEKTARAWLTTSPEAYCNVSEGELIRMILPSFDQETPDFFRWRVSYRRGELDSLLKEKLAKADLEVDLGTLFDIIPLERGASGRISLLRFVGSQRTLDVGKELEIRRLLSPSHLYSSAFVVEKRGTAGTALPNEFILHGGGWGHGVGLCQIGAAKMAWQGFSAEAILRHYFPLARLQKLY